jgi:hypothetical protein
MKTILLSRGAVLLVLVSLLTLNSGGSALACAACYGDTTGDKMGTAATWGIVVMTILMFIMLGAIAAFGYYLAWRAKHPLPDYEELLGRDEGRPQPGTPL